MIQNKHKLRLLFRDGICSTILSLVTCFLLSLLFFNASFFDPLDKALTDFSFLDVYYAERLNTNQTIDTNIVLVNIENHTRNELATMLQKVLDGKPKVVGFDILLQEFEKTAADSLLADALNRKNVITTYIAQQDSIPIENHPFFGGSGISGFANFNFKSKNTVIREFQGLYTYNNMIKGSFTTELAKKFLPEDVWERRRIEDKIRNPRVINYQGGLDHFLHFTSSELINLEDTGILSDKVVLIGYLGTPIGNTYDIEDKHFTPLNPITAGKSTPDMYGLVIHANILSMIINDNFMYKVPSFWTFLLMFLCSLLASIYFIWLGTRLKISYRTVRKAIIFVFSILLVWLTLVLFKNGIVLKSASIIAVTVFSAGFVKYYKHLAKYIDTKVGFDNYFKK